MTTAKSKRVYEQTVRKWATRIGLGGASIAFLIFLYLQAQGAITVTGYSGDTVCAGTLEDPCYAYINFTANQDIYIYPLGHDPWGRNTPFAFEPRLKDWKLQRSWGNAWRTIDLNTTWNKNVNYAVKFTAGQSYELRVIGYKQNAFQDIKWGFGPVDPQWLGIKKEDIFTKLISTRADLTYGEAIFELRNPFKDIPGEKLAAKFTRAAGKQPTQYELYINKTRKLQQPAYKTQLVKKTCTEANGTKRDCSYYDNILDHYDNLTVDDWLPLKTIPPGTSKIKLIARWEARLGPQEIDWIPELTIPKEHSGALADINISRKEWAWWNSSWQKRRKITFNNTNWASENLSNFPVLVKLDSTRIDYSLVEDDYDDLRFTDSDNTTLLDYEVEKWNESGNSTIWVEVPQIDNDNNDYIYMYYNYTSAPAGEDIEGTWNANYMGVWHMSQTSGDLRDSTKYQNNGSTIDVQAQGTAIGLVDGSTDFETTSSDEVICDENGSLDLTSKITAEALIKPESLATGSRYILAKGSSSLTKNKNYYMATTDSSTYWWWLAVCDGTACNYIASSNWNITTAGIWYYLVGTFDTTANNITLYMNGTYDTSGSITRNPATRDNLQIGRHSAGTGRYYDGLIDEIRISDTVRSADWINATWQTLTDNYLQFASEESAPAGDPDINISYWTGSAWNEYTSNTWIEFTCAQTESDCEPTNQDSGSSQCIFKVCNNGTATGDVDMKLNASISCAAGTFAIKADDDYTAAGATTLTTSYQEIHASLAQDACQELCIWADTSGVSPPCNTYTPSWQIT